MCGSTDIAASMHGSTNASDPIESVLPYPVQTSKGAVTIRRARRGDGKKMWQLAKEAGLELNSAYMHNLFCQHFTQTCVVGFDSCDNMVSYLLGYKPPSQQDTLFVWQLGVHPAQQRCGLGLAMLSTLTTDLGVSYLQASMTDSNVASNNMFQKFAQDKQCQWQTTKDWVSEDDFPSDERRPAETLYVVGPFKQRLAGECPGTVTVGPPDELLAGIAKVEDSPDGPFREYVCKHNDESKLVHLEHNQELKWMVQKESNARTYVRRYPFVVARAEGSMLTDTHGHKYLDFLGCCGTLSLGHNHPVQNEAMRAHLENKQALQVLDMATDAKAEYMKELFAFMPPAFKDDFRVQFCGGSGSDAVDAAVKLCKIATGRSTVMCFHGAYHGMGQGPLAMMGNLGCKGAVQGLMPGVQFLPYPNSYRQPFGMEPEAGGAGDRAVMTYIEHILNDCESGVTKPACVVLEVVQGEGGLNRISDWALRELRRITREHDIPMVIDEIQSGFCRSGRKFAFEYSGITPDVVTISKAAGGSQPLACVVYDKRLDKWGPGAHTGTFRGNGLAFSAGAATMRLMREQRLWEQVHAKGQLFQELIAAGRCDYVGDVRGLGLMVGLELIDPKKLGKDGLPCASGALCAQVQIECLKRGLIIERGGRSGAVLRPLPPLIVTEAQIKQAVEIILEAIKSAAAKVL